VDDTEYQKQYDAAAAALDAAAQATPAAGAEALPVVAEKPPEPVEIAKEEEAAKPDPMAELTARVEKAEKVARDNQAWATKAAQEAAQLRRERDNERREASKPTILDANPELADAIRYVTQDPAPAQQRDQQAQAWQSAIDKAHPGIFSPDLDPDLLKSLETRLSALDDTARQDPLLVIREITEEKLAHAERNIGKRFAAESAKLAQKSAMSVPGAGTGGGIKTAPNAALDEVRRIQNMTDADFQKEVRRVKGC
jgi:hypothetical protein